MKCRFRPSPSREVNKHFRKEGVQMASKAAPPIARETQITAQALHAHQNGYHGKDRKCQTFARPRGHRTGTFWQECKPAFWTKHSPVSAESESPMPGLYSLVWAQHKGMSVFIQRHVRESSRRLFSREPQAEHNASAPQHQNECAHFGLVTPRNII